jgi:hypothetical protein
MTIRALTSLVVELLRPAGGPLPADKPLEAGGPAAEAIDGACRRATEALLRVLGGPQADRMVAAFEEVEAQEAKG